MIPGSLTAALMLLPAGLIGVQDAPIDFTRDIRPILSQHCFACHGPDEHAREADLSLLTFEAATAPRRRGQIAIAPGNLEDSRLWQRINDADDPMPPPEAHNPLTQAQKDRIKQWIEQGASYAPHWAYLPPQRTTAPEGTWGSDPIDHWIDARLQREGLEHARRADPATLLRRVHTDLNGLPPTTGELDAFLADHSDQALESVVDDLLSREAYGERLAILWLDLVRFADTVGYHGDQVHHIWPYREWVINALNDNMPFDRFTIEQLAGDLLDEPTQDQLVATAYNRLIQTSHEGGVQLKEYRAIYMADRIRNASAVWMGATMGCAQCHDHKYDPYSAKDFYSMGAFFADIDDEEHLRKPYDGLNSSPTRRSPEMQVHTDVSRAAEALLRASLEQSRTDLDHTMDALTHERATWEQALRETIDSGEKTDTLWLDDDNDTGGHIDGDWNFEAGTDVRPHSGEAFRRQHSEGLIQHYTKDTDRRITIQAGDLLYTWVHLSPEDPPRAVMLQFNAGGDDWNHRAVWGDDSIGYGRREAPWPGYVTMGPLPETGTWVRLAVDASTVGLAPGSVVSGWAFTQFGGAVLWDRAGVESAPASEAVEAALLADVRTEAQQTLLEALQAERSPAVLAHRAALKSAERQLNRHLDSLPKTLYTRHLETPREVRILPRGNWMGEGGDVVRPAIPAFLGSLNTEGRADRLDLARWLVTPIAEGGVGELTARVLVNRLWAMLLGSGLCPSLEDFGGQGRPPVHLELLDMLALDLIESGWDIKAMLRRMALTETYRQVSVPDDLAATRDPENLLFARQSRSRLPAELVRDRLLTIAGLLVHRIGGPSAKPPQPAGLYKHLNFPGRRYQADMDDSQWRRGVYMHWQRQFLHPMLRAFDGPTRQECTANRPVSNTPLAALALLNDPVAMDAARAFAGRILRHKTQDDRTRLVWAMREATGRSPDAAEVDRLEALLGSSLEHWKADPEAASTFAGNDTDPAVVAAWTQVARALLNLHETINRD